MLMVVLSTKYPQVCGHIYLCGLVSSYYVRVLQCRVIVEEIKELVPIDLANSIMELLSGQSRHLRDTTFMMTW